MCNAAGRFLASVVFAILVAALAGADDPRPVDLTDLKEAVQAASKKGANVFEVAQALAALEKRLAKDRPALKPGDKPPAELTTLRAAVQEAARKGEDVAAIRAELDALEKALLGRIVRDAPAAVIIVANETPADVALAIAEPGEKPRKHTIRSHHVQPVTLAGPASLTSPDRKWDSIRVEPYRAYVIQADEMGRVRVEGILPDRPAGRGAGSDKALRDAPKRDSVRRDPVKVPVTLLVDDADPRTTARWRADVRKRFDAAARILEAQTGFRLEVEGFATWKSDRKVTSPEAQLSTFEARVRVKAGGLAIGFISRKMNDGKDVPFGACRGVGAAHVLVREWVPKDEGEQVEVLLRYLAIALGAVESADSESVMRSQLGDGQALFAHFVIRLDPLNALALNLWADQRRAGVMDLAVVRPADRPRLLAIYRALAAGLPADARAARYAKELEQSLPKSDDPVGNP